MKKQLALLLVCSLALGSFSFAVAETKNSEVFNSGNWNYSLLNDESVIITRYIGDESDVVVPEEIDGKPVTGIGNGAFYMCNTPVFISIPESVSYIEVNPFIGCSHLQRIRISPDHPHFAIIDRVLFSKADKRLISYPCTLRSAHYVIPDGVQIIGDYAFYGIVSLKSIKISETVRSIGEYSFSGCRSLISIDMPGNMMSIGENAFEFCNSLSEMTIPEGIVMLQSGTFLACESLERVYIPDGLESVGSGSFSFCKSLISINLPDSVISIAKRAFMGCTSALTVVVGRDSYAKQYCEDNHLNYIYPDANDWLNN